MYIHTLTHTDIYIYIYTYTDTHKHTHRRVEYTYFAGRYKSTGQPQFTRSDSLRCRRPFITLLFLIIFSLFLTGYDTNENIFKRQQIVSHYLCTCTQVRFLSSLSTDYAPHWSTKLYKTSKIELLEDWTLNFRFWA